MQTGDVSMQDSLTATANYAQQDTNSIVFELFNAVSVFCKVKKHSLPYHFPLHRMWWRPLERSTSCAGRLPFHGWRWSGTDSRALHIRLSGSHRFAGEAHRLRITANSWCIPPLFIPFLVDGCQKQLSSLQKGSYINHYKSIYPFLPSKWVI